MKKFCVDVKKFDVDVKKFCVDVKKFCVDLKKFDVDVKNFGVDVKKLVWMPAEGSHESTFKMPTLKTICLQDTRVMQNCPHSILLGEPEVA